jgi:hypothetical protein
VILEEIIRLSATTLTDTEQTLYNNTTGAVIKTMMLCNPNSTETEVTLSLDGVSFLFVLAVKETKIVDSHFVVNILKATGLGVNIHISGMQLEVI